MRTIQGVATPNHADDWSVVETRDDFLMLVALLAQEWEADQARRQSREADGRWAAEGEVWSQGTPGAWLEAMHAWLSALVDGPRESLPVDLENASWRTLAFVLAGSRRYE